jgi:hypothetical protein
VDKISKLELENNKRNEDKNIPDRVKEEKLCHYYKKPNHFIKECRKRIQNMNQGYKPQSPSYSRDRRPEYNRDYQDYQGYYDRRDDRRDDKKYQDRRG